jgi:uncharacterized membrane protein
MNWLVGYRLRRLRHSSLYAMALTGMAMALLAGPAVLWLDDRTRWVLLGFGAEGARAVLAALSSALLTFIVFSFSLLLLAVQMAGAQLSPRIIGRVFESRLTKLTLGVFVFSFTYSLSALGRVEERVPQLPVLLAILSSLGGVALFLFLIQSTSRGFRPITVLTRVGEDTRRAIDAVYPEPLPPPSGPPPEAVPFSPPGARPVAHRGEPGAIVAFDVAGLAGLAAEADCVVELVSQVGDFVAAGDELLILSGPGSAAADDDVLRRCVALEPERTLENDPAFGFRIIVDIAIKALSPAINDPTTAVLAIDQLDHLLHILGRRRLGPRVVRDASGRVRLVCRMPGWEEFVALAVTEIRLCAGQSMTVYRRLQAMFEHLAARLPVERVRLIEEEMLLMHRTVGRSLADPSDRALAGIGDRQGLGGLRYPRG